MSKFSGVLIVGVTFFMAAIWIFKTWSVFRGAEQLSGEEGGFGVGHAGDEVHDADVGGIEVVFFSGSTNTHEGDGLLFTVADFLAGFQLVDSRF